MICHRPPPRKLSGIVFAMDARRCLTECEDFETRESMQSMVGSPPEPGLSQRVQHGLKASRSPGSHESAAGRYCTRVSGRRGCQSTYNRTYFLQKRISTTCLLTDSSSQLTWFNPVSDAVAHCGGGVQSAAFVAKDVRKYSS
jgi:hypothetical protein